MLLVTPPYEISATVVMLECSFIWLDILDPILPMLSIVVLGICFVQEDPMSWQENWSISQGNS